MTKERILCMVEGENDILINTLNNIIDWSILIKLILITDASNFGKQPCLHLKAWDK